MAMTTTSDGTGNHGEDGAPGQPAALSHGRPGLHRAGDGMATSADDRAELIEALDPPDAVLAGHPTGGEVARYIGRHGTPGSPRPSDGHIDEEKEYPPCTADAAGRPSEWRGGAACLNHDPDLFFPEGTAGPALLQADQAKRVCESCPVRTPCLGFALRHGVAFGIWGGATAEERRRHRAAWLGARHQECRDGNQGGDQGGSFRRALLTDRRGMSGSSPT